MATSPAPDVKSSGKKRGSKTAIGDGETPSKKQRTKTPESIADFTESDHLIVNMKNKEKAWTEITTAYAALVGKEVAAQFCRQRYPKLMAVIQQDWKSGDVSSYHCS